MLARPSRPTLFLLVSIVLTVTYFLSRSEQPWEGARFYRDSALHGVSLRNFVKHEESRYNDFLKDRAALVKKLGPTEKDVIAFPEGYHLYTLWDFFLPAFPCPHRVERIGTMGDGGKWVCGMERIEKKDKCVIYSFGVNGESSFEADLLKRNPGCEVWGYDYSVNAFGPEIDQVPELKQRSHFFAWALGGEDKHGANDEIKFYTLQSLMKLNGHDFIDILKIDIEGAEFDSMTALVNSYKTSNPFGETLLPFGQLQLEIHAREGHEDFPYFVNWWRELEAAGLRPFWTEPNLVYINLVRGVKPELAEYSFMNIRGNHALISDDEIMPPPPPFPPHHGHPE
ncbi:hypothetical protein FA95DRAFT_1518257 [Auriscalpium vulgare]|uniref:Uncharacterized protein n=1 Tax=Auriscalpium vulgare TaxID=40419 RepID=A0ACB8RV04_9AGAM|nr:hypothetical protein FA95DRAFT_1518257 [Auriscalpium vulgare]